MGRYATPLIDDLTKNILRADKEYKSSNSERKFLLHLLVTLISKTHDINVIIGAVIYAIEKISAEYKVCPAKLIQYSFFKSGSQLLSLLNACLPTTKDNHLNDKEKFIYLMEFFNFAKDNLQRFEYKSYKKINLIDDMILISGTVLKRLEPEIKILLKRPPIKPIFLINFAKLPENYKKHYDEYHSKNRKKFADFISIFEQMCRIPTATDDQFLLEDFNIRYGILLHIMLYIEEKYYVLSPENSKLYKLCQQAMNINHSTELSNLNKQKYLSALYTYICLTLADQTKLLIWQHNGLDGAEAFFKSLERRLWKQMSIFREQIENGIENSKLNTAFSSIVATTSKYTAKVLVAGINLRTLSTILAPEYAILMTLVVLVDNPIKNTIIDLIARTVNPVFAITLKKSLQFAYHNIVHLNDQSELNESWYRALNSAPDTLFSKENKESLKRVVDFNELVPGEYRIEEGDQVNILEPIPSAPYLSIANK